MLSGATDTKTDSHGASEYRLSKLPSAQNSGGRARASVVNLENENEVWDYSEVDENEILEQKMEVTKH